MSPLFGKTVAFLALVAVAVLLGYTLREVRGLKDSLARTIQGNDTNLTEMMISLAHAEGQLARVREAVDLLGAGGFSEEPDAAALEGKLTVALSAAQREVLQQELKKWAGQLRDDRDKALAAVRQSLEKELSRSVSQGNQQLSALVERRQGSLARQLKEMETNLGKPSGGAALHGAALANLEKRLAAVAESVTRQGQALAQRNERDDRRWEELSLALEETMEATRRRYAEVAALLKAGAAPAPANEARPAPAGQESRRPDGVLTEREWLEAFCAEVPQSTFCTDL